MTSWWAVRAEATSLDSLLDDGESAMMPFSMSMVRREEILSCTQSRTGPGR